MGYIHARSYQAVDSCELVGVADLSQQNLDRFAATFNVPYIATDYRGMLSELRPDIVSIATYVDSHREIIEACAQAGVKGIWCEKPLCLSMHDGEALINACEAHAVKLIVHHYRRYLHAVQEVRQLLRSGMIGTSVEFIARNHQWDLMESGTHWLDMMRFFANDQPALWVMGQAISTGQRKGYANVQYGHAMDDYGLAYICFADGTRGILESGGSGNEESAFRLIGTKGLIDLYDDGTIRIVSEQGVATRRPHSTMHRVNPGYEADDPYVRVLQALLAWMEGGPEPGISGRSGLRTSELYLAAYESARRRGRVDLPLAKQTHFPLDDLVMQQTMYIQAD